MEAGYCGGIGDALLNHISIYHLRDLWFRLMLDWSPGFMWISATPPVPTGMDSNTTVPLIISKANSI